MKAICRICCFCCRHVFLCPSFCGPWDSTRIKLIINYLDLIVCPEVSLPARLMKLWCVFLHGRPLFVLVSFSMCYVVLDRLQSFPGFMQQFYLPYSVMAHPVPFLSCSQFTCYLLDACIKVFLCVFDAPAVRRYKPLLYLTARANNIPGALSVYWSERQQTVFHVWSCCWLTVLYCVLFCLSPDQTLLSPESL